MNGYGASWYRHCLVFRNGVLIVVLEKIRRATV
jgi:hypothetical protein